jgi:hypothetical protein
MKIPMLRIILKKRCMITNDISYVIAKKDFINKNLPPIPPSVPYPPEKRP